MGIGKNIGIHPVDPLEDTTVPAVDLSEGERAIYLREILALLRSERSIYQDGWYARYKQSMRESGKDLLGGELSAN